MARLCEEHVDGVTVLRISGSLTVDAVPEVEAPFGLLAERDAARVVADVGQVDAVTTPAISLILKTAWAIRARGGMMVLANVPPVVRKVLTCCGLDLVLDLVEDVPGAIRILHACVPDTPFALRLPTPPLLPPDGSAGGLLPP